MQVIKHSRKKEKTKKIFLLYITKTFKRKKERNLNEGELGLKASFEKEKTKVHPRGVAEDHFRYMIT